MIVCTTGYDLDISVHQSLAKCLCIINDRFSVCFEIIGKSFLEADCFCCDHMHQRTALDTRENCLVEIIFICCFLIAEDHTATWSAQCLMCCRCYNICVWDRAFMHACCNQTCNMCHIYHKYGTDFIGDLTEFLKIDLTCISRSSCNDHLWLTFQCDLSYLIIIDKAFIINAIWYTVEIFTGHIHR